MKRILLLLLLTALWLSTACGVSYTDSVPAEALGSAVLSALPSPDDYALYGQDYVSAYFPVSDNPTDFYIAYSVTAEDVGEFGIFRMADEEGAKLMKSAIDSYLNDMRSTQLSFLQTYAPREVAKLEEAEARVLGSYAVYAILSQEDRATLFETIDKQIKQ